MSDDRVPLFVRLPREQADALDRLVDSSGRRKQHVVSDLLADRLTVGHVELAHERDAEEVLTLQEAAALLRLGEEAIRARAIARELPGRAFGDEWRFARAALLAWLADGEQAARGHERAGPADRG
jgi:excisionase family DNA binding protein